MLKHNSLPTNSKGHSKKITLKKANKSTIQNENVILKVKSKNSANAFREE